MFHEREQVLTEGFEAEFGRIAHGARPTVRPRVERDEPKAGGRLEQTERLAYVGPEAVLEKEWQTGASLLVVKLDWVASEDGHKKGALSSCPPGVFRQAGTGSNFCTGFSRPQWSQ
jgi:hypothetical protein